MFSIVYSSACSLSCSVQPTLQQSPAPLPLVLLPVGFAQPAAAVALVSPELPQVEVSRWPLLQPFALPHAPQPVADELLPIRPHVPTLAVELVVLVPSVVPVQQRDGKLSGGGIEGQ